MIYQEETDRHGMYVYYTNISSIFNIYCCCDIDAKNRIRSLNEFSKINLNAIRREGMHDDGVFNDCQLSDQDENHLFEDAKKLKKGLASMGMSLKAH